MFKFIRWLIGFCIFIAICLFALYCTICIVFPIKYIDTIEKYSQKYDLDPAFVCAIIKTESNFKPEVTSHKGAMGLMQLMPATVDWAVEKIPIEDFSYDTIQEPETNIQIGCWVLNFLGNQFGENDELIALPIMPEVALFLNGWEIQSIVVTVNISTIFPMEKQRIM